MNTRSPLLPLLLVSLALPAIAPAWAPGYAAAYAQDSQAQDSQLRTDAYFYDKALHAFELPEAELPCRIVTEFQVPASSVKEAETRLEDLEQTCLMGAPKVQQAKAAKIKDLYRSAAERLQPSFREAGITVAPEVDRDWDFRSWEGQKAWVAALQKLPEPERCERLELAYAFAIWQLSTLEPTRPIRDIRDILIQDKPPSPDVQLDRRRAAWALRYLRFVPTEVFPRSCHCVAPGRCLEEEARARWQFIFSDRKPLGYAFGMCARPMNAHYLDDEVTEGRRSEPKGWDFGIKN